MINTYTSALSVLLDLAIEKGLSPVRVSNTEGGEYHSACPLCGGKDRFVIQPYKQGTRCIGRYFCRQCKPKGGDTLSFCIDIMGKTYQEAEQIVGVNTLKSHNKSFTSSNFFHKQIKKELAPLNKPPDLWIEKASELIDLCHKNLLQHEASLKYLCNRGVTLEAVNKYKIGLCLQDQYPVRSSWGLEEEPLKELWVPVGIIIPTIEPSGVIVAIKVRCRNYKKDDKYPKYVAIPGSAKGLRFYGNKKLDVMIIVESEFDAIAIDASAGDIAFAIAVGGCTKNPDNVSDYYAKNKKHVLVFPDNDLDNTGQKMSDKWQKDFDSIRIENGLTPLKPCLAPNGKDIGEYIQQGGDLRSFILQVLPVEPNIEQVQAPVTQVVPEIIDAPTIPQTISIPVITVDSPTIEQLKELPHKADDQANNNIDTDTEQLQIAPVEPGDR